MIDFDLPKGWLLTSLGEIADWGAGGTPSRKTESYYGGNIPWVKTGDLGPKVLTQASEFITEQAVANSSAKFFPKGSVAIAMYGATIGKTSILGIDTTTNQACGVGNPIKGITFTEFLYYMLCNEKDNFIAKGKGGAQPNISQALIKEHEIALPPLAEQQQIAQKLDELLAQVDTLKTRLDAIPNILKRFRQSVLAAAVSGRLTEEWRGQNGAPLWRNLALGEITSFQNGFAFKSEWFSGVGDCQVLKLGNIKNGELRLNASPAFVDENIAELHKKYMPDPEDILITMTGTKYKRDYGFTCLVPKNLKTLINQRVGRIIPDKSVVMPRYLLIFLQSKIFLDEFFKGETGGVNQGNVGSEHIKSCVVALPLLEEQTEIVRRVEQLFAYADQIEQRVKDAQARVNHLTQSILAKAFRGELTADWRAQNPELISGENSAAALLERVKAEREAVVKPKRKLKT
ncbi:restriction endonuclease subunit S [Cellvibrio sp. QJXJ]|uniref:restriction endonuclease subunit S n=1 Tax=Cellvibrio sp. QJXJ TaxID=2964606 RepID=UPI0021C3FE21|nr:restriction endonuclease subunit S [Cellvibrio sp. QJXJ]UUA71791.1 restriction endonuclease subunit S [Cellvibrio sp. QJXJ]